VIIMARQKCGRSTSQPSVAVDWLAVRFVRLSAAGENPLHDLRLGRTAQSPQSSLAFLAVGYRQVNHHNLSMNPHTLQRRDYLMPPRA
jgi:hypothetical protein